MSEDKIYAVSPDWQKRAWLDEAKYKEMYAASIKDPEKFWGEEAKKRIHWMKPFTKVKNTSFDGNVSIKWFEDGKTNISYNCIDRHLEKRGDQVAIIWEGDEPTDDKKITYKELHAEVCRWANVLKAQGAKKGDRITIYMPMIPEAAYAMLACARIGAIHSVVFGGFSPDSLAGRIEDCKSEIVVTADEGIRGGRKIPLKANTDAAADKAGGVKSVIVVKRTNAAVDPSAETVEVSPREVAAGPVKVGTAKAPPSGTPPLETVEIAPARPRPQPAPKQPKVETSQLRLIFGTLAVLVLVVYVLRWFVLKGE